MDLLLTDNLDIGINNGTYGTQENGETTLLQAFFTDARVSEKRGYWLDIQQSEIWQFQQKRLTQETANDLNEVAREIANSLVNEGLYDRIETNVLMGKGILELQIKCYDTRSIVVDRKFKI